MEKSIITVAELNIDVDKAITKAGDLGRALENLKAKKKALNKEDADYQEQLARLNGEIEITNKAYKNSVSIVTAHTAALKQEDITIQQLEIQNKGLAASQKTTNLATEQGIKDSAALNEAYNKNINTIKNFSSEAKQQGMNIGNYGKEFSSLSAPVDALGSKLVATKPKFDALGNSMSQLSREGSAFVNSASTGFMAISNNIPAFSDAIKALKDGGASTKDIFKQIGGSLLSFNFLLGVGITVLTIYGPKLVHYIETLFKIETQLKATTKAQIQYNEAKQKGLVDAQKELTNLKIIYDATQDQSKSMTDRNKVVDELQKKYPKYFENMTNEAILTGKAGTKYKELTQSIIETARAKAIESKITENAVKQLDIETKINDIQKEREALQRKIIKESNEAIKIAENNGVILDNAKKEAIERGYVHRNSLDIKESAKKIELFKKEVTEIDKINSDLQKKINIKGLIEHEVGPKDSNKSVSIKTDNTDWYVKQMNDVNEKLLPESLDKRKNIIIDKYEVLRLEIKKKMDKDEADKTLTDLGRTDAKIAIEKSKELEKLEIKRATAGEEAKIMQADLERYKETSELKLQKDAQMTPTFVMYQEKRLNEIYDKEVELINKKVDAEEMGKTESTAKIEKLHKDLQSNIIELNNTFNESERQRSIVQEQSNYENQLSLLYDFQDEKMQLQKDHNKALMDLELIDAEKKQINKELIIKKYAKRDLDIERATTSAKLDIGKKITDGLAGLFKENTVAHKVAAGVSIGISTVDGAMKAFAAAGNPILGSVMAGLVVAEGVASLAKLASIDDNGVDSVSTSPSNSNTPTIPPVNINSQASVGNGIIERNIPNIQTEVQTPQQVLVLQDVEYQQYRSRNTNNIKVD